jgi:hypothetical protein
VATTKRPERQQLEAFLDRYNEDIAMAARRALRDLRRRVPGAMELVYDNYNALGIGFGPSERASEVILSIVAYPRWVTRFFLQGMAHCPGDPRGTSIAGRGRTHWRGAAGGEGARRSEAQACTGHQVRVGAAAAAAADSQAPPGRYRAVVKIHKSGVDYATVRELALALPDVVDSSTLRGISFKARGKLLACKAINRSAEPETLMMRVGAAERDRLLAAMPEICYLTPHYLVNESVLVRLAKVDRKTLQELLGLAWKFVTTKPAKASKSAKRRKAGSVFRYL